MTGIDSRILTELELMERQRDRKTRPSEPLAIELAVAHLSSFSPRDLDRLLKKDFDLVGLLPRDTPDRHHTLRNMIQWSYDRLDARDKTVLDQLSIFVGGADLDACLHVISGEGVSQNGLIEALARLVEKSLVIRVLVESSTKRTLRNCVGC